MDVCRPESRIGCFFCLRVMSSRWSRYVGLGLPVGGGRSVGNNTMLASVGFGLVGLFGSR